MRQRRPPPLRIERLVERTYNGTFRVQITRPGDRISRTFPTLEKARAFRDFVTAKCPPTKREDYTRTPTKI